VAASLLKFVVAAQLLLLLLLLQHFGFGFGYVFCNYSGRNGEMICVELGVCVCLVVLLSPLFCCREGGPSKVGFSLLDQKKLMKQGRSSYNRE
jgi:hypothetical protein